MGFKSFLKKASGIAKDFSGEISTLSTALGQGTDSGFLTTVGSGFNLLAQREARQAAEALAKAEAAAAQNRDSQETSSRAPSNVVLQVPKGGGSAFPPWALPVALGGGALALILALRK